MTSDVEAVSFSIREASGKHTENATNPGIHAGFYLASAISLNGLLR